MTQDADDRARRTTPSRRSGRAHWKNAGHSAASAKSSPWSSSAEQRCIVGAGAADRVGQVEILDRIAGDRRPPPSRRAWAAFQSKLGEPELGRSAGTSRAIAARSSSRLSNGSVVPSTSRQRAQDRPVLARVARREHRALAALHAAFEIDVGARLLGIARARQDHVGRCRALVAMMADIDLEALGELARNRPRRRRAGRPASASAATDVGDAARLRIAEHQPAHPRRRRCGATLKPFQPSRTRLSVSTSASAAPCAPGLQRRRRRRSPPAARRSSNASAAALGSLPSSDRSSPSHSTL